MGINLSGSWERELNKLAQDAMSAVASDYQAMFDRLGRQCKGRPVAEVKGALRREWSRLGGTISDAELTEYATLISEGTKIEMRVR